MTSTSFKNDLDTLLPSALVYEKVFADDPLLHESDRTNIVSHENGSVMEAAKALDREAIGTNISYLLELAPLISNGIVSVLPISRQHVADKRIPILFSEDNFDSDIPPHIRSFVYESARISEVVRSDIGLLILPTGPEKPVRTIAVHFDQDHFTRPGKVFFLSQVTPTGHADGKIFVEQDFDPSIPISQTEFETWLRNATNTAVLARLEDASFEMGVADLLNAVYLTDSGFEAKLFALSSATNLPVDSRATATNFLNANAGFLDISSAAQIANVRTGNPVLFEKFQASLLHVASELTGLDEGFEDKARQIFVKEIEPQVQAVNTQLSKARINSVASALVATSAFSLALLKLPDLPLAVALAAHAAAALAGGVAGTLPGLGERQLSKRTPAYIWAQIAKK
jgi:hypothetical protein